MRARGLMPRLGQRVQRGFLPQHARLSTLDCNNKIPIRWLDLRGLGLSILERLLLEECLLQTTPDCSWVIAGYHDASNHRYLSIPHPPLYTRQAPNPTAVIVMGIGGKVDQLLHTDHVRKDGVLTVKRFSGGGTVVLDHDSIWTTLIGRPQHFDGVVQAFPRNLMEYSALAIFGPLFDRLHAKQQQEATTRPLERKTMVMDIKSCAVENSGRLITIPARQSPADTTIDTTSFELRENDFVFGQFKMAGNAQSITKHGWLHHTSFLWDYQDEHMEYLTLPSKRPEYRQDRAHDDFLCKLSNVYPSLTKRDFLQQLGLVCEEQFEVESVTLPQVMAHVNQQGGLQQWWETKSRTKLVEEL